MRARFGLFSGPWWSLFAVCTWLYASALWIYIRDLDQGECFPATGREISGEELASGQWAVELLASYIYFDLLSEKGFRF